MLHRLRARRAAAAAPRPDAVQLYPCLASMASGRSKPEVSPLEPIGIDAHAWRDSLLGITLAESLQTMISDGTIVGKEARDIFSAFDEARHFLLDKPMVLQTLTVFVNTRRCPPR